VPRPPHWTPHGAKASKDCDMPKKAWRACNRTWRRLQPYVMEAATNTYMYV
jgi:hypothetical protein